MNSSFVLITRLKRLILGSRTKNKKLDYRLDSQDSLERLDRMERMNTMDRLSETKIERIDLIDWIT